MSETKLSSVRNHIVFCTGDANDLAMSGADFVVQLQILHAHELAADTNNTHPPTCFRVANM